MVNFNLIFIIVINECIASQYSFSIRTQPAQKSGGLRWIKVRVPAQIIPVSVTTADGHFRDAHLLLEKAGDPFVAEGVKAQFRESQGFCALGKPGGDRLHLERKNPVMFLCQP